MDMFDVIAVGGAKVDIFLDIHDTNQHFRLNEETGKLCIKSGDKVFVDKAHFMIGGNAANVAVGVARMGLKSAVVEEIGSDEFAQKIVDVLNKEGVSERLLKKVQGTSPFSVIINYKKDRTIFVEHEERNHDLSFNNIKTKWVYLTSMSDKWHDAYKKVLDFTAQNNIKLAFNPGTTQLDEGVNSFRDVLLKTEILFINKEEGLQIAKADIHFSDTPNYKDNVRKLLLAVKNIGPKVVVMTDGKNGSFMVDDKRIVLEGSVDDTKVVERTGAGDAFASGFLSAVLAGRNYQTAMKWGSENATSVIGKIGATAGLLTKEEMEKREKNNQ